MYKVVKLFDVTWFFGNVVRNELTLNLPQPPLFVESVFSALFAHQVIWLHKNSCVTHQSTHFYFIISQKLLARWVSYWSLCSVTEDLFNCWSCKHDADMSASVPSVCFISYSSELFATAHIVPLRYSCHSLTICTQFIVMFSFRWCIKNLPFFLSVYVSFVAIVVMHINNVNLNNIQQLNVSAFCPKGHYSLNSMKRTQLWLRGAGAILWTNTATGWFLSSISCITSHERLTFGH